MHKWKTPPCLPRDVWSGTLHHRPENSPNTKVRQMLCDGKREPQRTERPWRPHQQLQTSVFSILLQLWLALSLYLSLFSLLTPMNRTHFLFSQLVFSLNCSARRHRSNDAFCIPGYFGLFLRMEHRPGEFAGIKADGCEMLQNTHLTKRYRASTTHKTDYSSVIREKY